MVSFTSIATTVATLALAVSAAPLSKRASGSGTATYYYQYQGGSIGACGNEYSDSAYVVALETSAYDNGSLCGKTIQITNTNTGSSVSAIVADECPTCVSSGSIDLSVAAFESLASLDEGVFPVSWSIE